MHRGPQSARIYLPQSKVAVDLFYITLAALSRSSSVRQLQKSIVKSALSLSGSVSLSLRRRRRRRIVALYHAARRTQDPGRRTPSVLHHSECHRMCKQQMRCEGLDRPPRARPIEFRVLRVAPTLTGPLPSVCDAAAYFVDFNLRRPLRQSRPPFSFSGCQFVRAFLVLIPSFNEVFESHTQELGRCCRTW